MAGEARLRGQSPAQEAHMRPRLCHGKTTGPRPGPPGPRPPAQKKKRRP